MTSLEERSFRFEYRHDRSPDYCTVRGWHLFCPAVDNLNAQTKDGDRVKYDMRTLPKKNTPRLIIAAALMDDEWWPADGWEEALQFGKMIETKLRKLDLLR